MKKIAAFFVDCQKGFTPLCPNELPVKEGHLIVDELNKIITQVKAMYLVGSKDCHPVNATWIAPSPDKILQPVPNGGPNIDVYWPAHCIVGTKGNELLDGIPSVENFDFFIFKGIEPNLHPYGACYHDIKEELSTGVIEYLWEKGVTEVVVGGLATDYCVKTTALQLKEAGFKVTIPLSACRGVAPDTTDKAIGEMKSKGIRIVQSVSDL
jgi:nicotinamidase/pyrazinamidase